MARVVQDDAATAFPVSRDEAKAHLHVTSTSEDAYIDSLIAAATSLVESDLNRSLITQTWILYLDGFPGGLYRQGRPAIYHGDPYQDTAIRLPKGPVQSVEAVKYVDTGGTTVTMTVTTDYLVDLSQPVPRIVPGYNRSWPETRDIPNAVSVEYTAGYGDDGTDVPGDLKQALLLIVGAWHQARASLSATDFKELPGNYAAGAILNRYRLLEFD